MTSLAEVIPEFFQRLAQALRSQDPSQLRLLFQFHFPSSPPLPSEVQSFISSLRLVLSLFVVGY